MSPRSFITAFVAFTMAIAGVYLWQFPRVLDAPIAGEYWLRGAKTVKRSLARGVQGPKVLLIGGSSTLFGIDAAGLSVEARRPVINLGLHAGLPLQYHLDLARPLLRRGDTAIVIPEYGHYSADSPSTAWFIQQVVAWDGEYLRSADPRTRAQFVMDTPLAMVVNAATAHHLRQSILARHPGRAPISDERVMEVFRDGWSRARSRSRRGKTPLPFQYFYDNLDDHGDILRTDGMLSPPGADYGLTSAFAPVPGPWRSLREFRRFCATNGVEIFLGLPPVLNGEIIARDRTTVVRHLRDLIEHAARQGIVSIDEPEAVFFDPPFFFDTAFHLNLSGRAIRTANLAKGLARARGKAPPPAPAVTARLGGELAVDQRLKVADGPQAEDLHALEAHRELLLDAGDDPEMRQGIPSWDLARHRGSLELQPGEAKRALHHAGEPLGDHGCPSLP